MSPIVVNSAIGVDHVRVVPLLEMFRSSGLRDTLLRGDQRL